MRAPSKEFFIKYDDGKVILGVRDSAKSVSVVLPFLKSKVFVGIIFFEYLHLSVTASIYITKSHG